MSQIALKNFQFQVLNETQFLNSHIHQQLSLSLKFP